MKIKQDGKQIYTEKLFDSDSLEPLVLHCQHKLRQLHDALPSSKWTATIETLWNYNGKLRKQTFDIDLD